MVSYTTRMPIGSPGRVSRQDNILIDSVPVSTATPPTVYGAPVKIVSGQLQPIASGDAATVVWGFLISPYPAQQTSGMASGFGAATPPAFGMADVLRRGFLIAPLTAGTAAKGGQVYVVTTAGGANTVGSIVTSASPGSSAAAVAIPGAYFTGPADAAGNVEIELVALG